MVAFTLPVSVQRAVVRSVVVVLATFTLFASGGTSVAPVHAATFTVTNTNDSGSGSLRQAILDSNADPRVTNTIAFGIGSGIQTIMPLSPLPAIGTPVVIDGTTQPGFTGKPLIELNGSNAGAGDGLSIFGANGTVRGLVINRFKGNGVQLFPGSANNLIEGNYIGTDVAGTTAMPNMQAGVLIDSDASNNTVGGTTAASRNIISGNDLGVQIEGRCCLGGGGPTGNQIQGNFIGTNATGTAALGNAFADVFLSQASGNSVGGALTGTGNVISGNGSYGVFLGAGATGNHVQGNVIGTNAAGIAAVGNPNAGVLIESDASNNLIGGPSVAARNVISGNGGWGVEIQGFCCSGPKGNQVLGNFIGTNAAGTVALANNGDGVIVQNGATKNIIGAPGAGNVISGNQFNGVVVQAEGNLVQANLIGTRSDGTSPLPNAMSGVLVRSSDNTVGGVGPGAGNTIAYNGGYGVSVEDGFGNAIFLNSIFANASGGIALGLDANNRAPAPVVTRATSEGGIVSVQAVLDDALATTYRIEFFVSPDCDRSGSGQGQTFLGADTADSAGGSTTFSQTFAMPVPPGQVITATATHHHNTSAFSGCRRITVLTPAATATDTATPTAASTLAPTARRRPTETDTPTNTATAAGIASNPSTNIPTLTPRASATRAAVNTVLAAAVSPRAQITVALPNTGVGPREGGGHGGSLTAFAIAIVAGVMQTTGLAIGEWRRRRARTKRSSLRS